MCVCASVHWYMCLCLCACVCVCVSEHGPYLGVAIEGGGAFVCVLFIRTTWLTIVMVRLIVGHQY